MVLYLAVVASVSAMLGAIVGAACAMSKLRYCICLDEAAHATGETLTEAEGR